ncbi:MAG: hypothetical protein K2K70_06860 [Lachnospiraceae bacterium]|nr:hypothetical protein [Lachnospiraceae bacterium]
MSRTKSKFDYEIEAFEAAFEDKKGLRIAVYGTGRMTATLLDRLKGFCIIGLLDRDESMIGKEIYGLKVISREEAEKNADIIIINTSETYWGTIYKRIQNWKIPVYFRNGVRASNEFFHGGKDNPYWEKTSAELEKRMEQYDVISFDIFDTLIMRKVYLPTDIFNIIERKLRGELGENFSFAEIRKRAASVCDNATIDEIYTEIEKMQNWNCELTKKVKQCEIDVEKRLIVPRKEIVRLYDIIKKEKDIFFISDMYFPRQILEEILLQCGIRIAKERIIVSCDYKKDKEGGLLWRYYADNMVKGRKALHIGDNDKTDGEVPKRYGIDSYVIWSAARMLQKSSIRNITPDVNTLYSSLIVGMINSRILNSPFALQRTCGKIYFEKEKEAGFCLLGSVMHVFCNWLFRQTKESQIRKLAFFSREGYLLTKLFKYYFEVAGEAKIPEVVYMEISRRAVLITSIYDEKDILEVSDFPYIGSINDFLNDRFGVLKEDVSLSEEECIEINESKENLHRVLKQYKADILSEADRERKNYLDYVESIGLTSEFAVVDSQLYGTTQYYLGKLLGKKLKGYYFCVCKDKTNRYLEQNIMEGCFPGIKGLDGKDSCIYKNAAFIEAFFTSPEGMLECIEDNGRKRYAEKKQNQIYFDTRLDMLEGIQEFLKEIIILCKEYNVGITSEDIWFTDNMFGIFMNDGFEPTDRMKKSFYYDNGIANRKEIPIWE